MLKLQVDGAPFPDVVELRPDVPPEWNAVIRAALDVDRARRPHAVDFAQRIAAGMANGKSLLRSLAPFAAIDRGPSAIAAVTLSADVPTAISQLGTGPISIPAAHGRLARTSLAIALASAVVGSLATLAAVKLSSGADRTYAEVADAGSMGAPSSPMGAALPAPDAGFVVRADAAVATLPDAAADAGVAVTVAPQVDAGVKVAPPPVRPIERGELVIAIDPFAEVWIDGGPVGPTPIRKLLPVGKHRVVLINKDKGKRESVDVTITAANRTVIEETW